MKPGGRPIQRLNLRLLVHAEHQGMVRRIDVQPDDIAHLLAQLRVWRQLEGLAAMRLQPKGLPHALDGHVTQARRLRHIARAPMRRPTRRGLQGRNHHLLHLRIGNPPWRARARFVDQPLQPVAQKARAPLAPGGPRDVEASGDAGRRPAGRTGQDDAGAPRHLRGTPRPVGHESSRCRSSSLTVTVTGARPLTCTSYRGIRRGRHNRLLVSVTGH